MCLGKLSKDKRKFAVTTNRIKYIGNLTCAKIPSLPAYLTSLPNLKKRSFCYFSCIFQLRLIFWVEQVRQISLLRSDLASQAAALREEQGRRAAAFSRAMQAETSLSREKAERNHLEELLKESNTFCTDLNKRFRSLGTPTSK